jgi:AAA family ATP:ADP antiporter
LLLRVLEILFPVRAGERQLTLVLLLQDLFAVGAFVAGRSVRDALFLAHADKGSLAWMYVASAVAVAGCGLAYAPLARRIRRDSMALGSASVFAVLFVGMFFAERAHRPWVYSALYVYVEVMGALTIVQFWTLTNELFNAREAKRLYGFIGAGGTLANVVIGLATGKIATRWGASAVLLLCAVLLIGCAAASFWAGRLGRQRMFARAAAGRAAPVRVGGAASRVFASGHLRTVAMLTAATFVAVTLVDFQFKVVASASYPQDQLAAYFGYFYAAIGVLALVLQLFGTGRLLNRAGVTGALVVLPATMGAGSLALGLFPSLWAASLAKGADTLFRYSINDATTQILYLPVPSHSRASSKAFIDGVIKPFAIGIGGLALLGYRHWFGGDPYRLAWLGVAICIIWIAMVVSLRAHYIRSLQDNLRNRRLDFASAPYKVVDGSTNSVLVRALESGHPREVLNALELLPHLENVHLDIKIEGLLDHALAEIRLAAVDYYGRRQAMRFANSIFRKFEDPDPRVRAAAITAFCAIGRDKSVRSVKTFLKDADPGIRSAALIGMIRYGGLDGVLVAAEALKQLISHAEPLMREHAARVLGAIGVQNFYQPVLELMNDPQPAVRRQAIQAAGQLKSPEFVIPLIYKTQSRETGREAVEALSQYGPGIVPTLATVIANRLEAPEIRRGVARVLGKVGGTEAIDAITRQLDEADADVRTQLYHSLSKAVRGGDFGATARPAVEAALNAELTRAYSALSAADVLKLAAGPTAYTPREGPKAAEALLASALSEQVAQTEYRVFLLLSVLYPDAAMERIHAGIRDALPADGARRRADAVELLDNLLDRALKRKLLPLLDDVRREEKLRAVTVLMNIPRELPDANVVALCRDESAWVRACAIFYAAELGTRGTADVVADAANDPNAVVREISLVSCVKASPERAAAIAEAHLTDEAPAVRRQAALIATSRAASRA